MFEMFDENKKYVFPTGASTYGRELLTKEEYAVLTKTNCAVNIVAGILRSIVPIGELAENYGIDESIGNQQILDQVNIAVKTMAATSLNAPKQDAALYTVARMYASTFTDEQALSVKDIYELYEVGKVYKKDEFFTYNGELFKVNQDHTSEEQWVPGESGTESLYTKITLNDAGHPIWKQPTGAHDAYNIGDIVEYNGQLYKSKIDGNTYAPDAYPDGWEVYIES